MPGMTKKNLVRSLATKTGTSKRTAARFLDTVRETAFRELKTSRRFALPGLGRFQTEPKKAGRRRPHDGKTTKPARPIVKFRVARRAQDRIRFDTLRVVLASPSDVKVERDKVSDVIDEINHGIGEVLGVRLELVRWEADAFPGFDVDGGQGLIDRALRIQDADILIGIFWKRFGTPVKNGQSGTEHEFLNAYKNWKKNKKPQIMMYFRQKAYQARTMEETKQWGRVLQFQKNFPKEGLWWPYSDRSEFEKLLREQLTNFLKDRRGKKGKHR